MGAGSHHAPLAPAAMISGPALVASSRDERVRAMLAQHFDFIWRSLRRLGLSADRADDAAQQVFLVAAGRIDDVPPASERSFLFGTALRVASDIRRSAAYRREIPHADAGDDLPGGPRPDEIIEQKDARAVLDRILDAMELDLRTVFVLYEIEEMTTSEIATLLEIPSGTVASRLRRAREEFKARLEKLRAKGAVT
ncbi:MAG: RNA polymerase sigma factor [Labilithrix sp.]|nr:RNA polymerase sigma factor [Labilithrix sp.]MCW5814275.1 RNA polymerase sigma factor [Labilithrix sp.]